jgi:dimethylglycine dehydrogenase
MYAMDSLRMEKCYRGWKTDMTHEYTPLMASLDRFVDLAKPSFRGRDALIREHNSGPKERLVPLVLDEAGDADAPSCAPVWRDGQIVGLVTSGAYGHALKKSIALAYVRTDLATPGTALDIEIFGERRAAKVGIEPVYDPNNARLRM